MSRQGRIVFFTGAEGSGKSLLMTIYALDDLKLGRKIFTFPGYDLTDGKGNILSTRIDIAEWAGLPPELQNATILIDETQNVVSSHNSMSVVADLLAALGAQRRKRNISILGTVQNYYWLPPWIRFLVHYLVICVDQYWIYHRENPLLKRGEQMQETWIDLKGFETGKPGSYSRFRVLRNADRFWKYFDSYSVVDPWARWTKVHVKGDEYDLVGGKLIKKEISDLNNTMDITDLGSKIGTILSSRDKQRLPITELFSYLDITKKDEKTHLISKILPQLGYRISHSGGIRMVKRL